MYAYCVTPHFEGTPQKDYYGALRIFLRCLFQKMTYLIKFLRCQPFFNVRGREGECGAFCYYLRLMAMAISQKGLLLKSQ